MKVGVTVMPNNAEDVDRFVALEAGEGEPIGDGVDDRIFEEELRFGTLVEELGFDSLWTVEHHFNPYTMVPDPLQWLSYWAAKTSRIDLGTMVTVLPWHSPVRVAEQISLLQHMVGPGRDLRIGFGRGAGRREFGGLDIRMDESRTYFNESVQIIRGLLTEERFGFQGEKYRVPDVSQRPESPDLSVRPRPRDSRALVDNFLVAWGSPQSVELCAPLGPKPMVMPQRPISEYTDEVKLFNSLRVDAGYEPANPMLHLHIVCCEDEAEAQSMMPYEAAFGRSAQVNYELGGAHFAKTKGYEYYAKLQEDMERGGTQQSNGDFSAGFVVAGTPDQILQEVEELCDYVHPEHLALAFKVGGMPYDAAQRSIRLFAKEVLPALQGKAVEEPIVGHSVKARA